jgi:hypothetical protein
MVGIVGMAHDAYHPRRREPALGSCSSHAHPALGPVLQLPNKRLKLAARVDYGMSLSSARRSLSAIR